MGKGIQQTCQQRCCCPLRGHAQALSRARNVRWRSSFYKKKNLKSSSLTAYASISTKIAAKNHVLLDFRANHKIACMQFARGNCSYGGTCKFAHLESSEGDAKVAFTDDKPRPNKFAVAHLLLTKRRGLSSKSTNSCRIQ